MRPCPEPKVCGWCLFSEPWEKMPNDDVDHHESGMDCRCRPYMDDGIITHNAYDRREDYETGRRKLS